MNGYSQHDLPPEDCRVVPNRKAPVEVIGKSDVAPSDVEAQNGLTLPPLSENSKLTDLATPHSATPHSVASSVAQEISPTLKQASIKGIEPAFYAMEKRRMRRVLNGRFHRGALCRYTAELSQIAIIAMLIVHFLKVDWEEISKYRQIPGIITGCMVLMKIAETISRPEHVIVEWLRLEITLFVLWMAWEYDRQAKEKNDCWWTDPDPCFLDSEKAVMASFGGVLAASMLFMGCRFYLLPCAVKKAFWGQGANVWWRIRTVGSESVSRSLESFLGHDVVDIGTATATRKLTASARRRREKVSCFSYRPSGWFSMRRAKFGYTGEVDDNGTPHGLGMWFDNTFHGECLQGLWRNGIPVGNFHSREYGTGAQFAQRPIAYATSRADCQPDDLSKASKMPGKVDQVRYGIAQVEVSLAGGFFSFLPDVQYSFTCAGVEEVRKVFDSGESQRYDSAVQQVDFCPQLQLSVVEQEEFTRMCDDEVHSITSKPTINPLTEVTLPIWFREGEREAYLNRADLRGPARCLVERPKEALVFFHGYNSDISTCVGRMAQLVSLGGMAHHIVPFVFSYSAGFALSYLQVKSRMEDYGDDLTAFFMELGQHFRKIHILCHSCGAQFFFGNVNKIVDCFASKTPSAKSIPHFGHTNSSKSSQKESSRPSLTAKKPHLGEVIMVNPDVLVDVVAERLPGVMEVAEHFTTYNDKKDGALFWSSFVATWVPSRLMRGIDMPERGRHAIVFGSVVSPLWLEQTKEGPCLRGPIVDLPGQRYPFGASSESVLQKLMNRAEMSADKRIDVIDCSSIDQNIHSLRHNYYMLNTQVVEDICELIGSRATALHRARLVRVEANVFNFLCPPADLIDL